MKICLLGINARYTHSNLALFYLRKYVGSNHKSIIIEKTINDSIYDILIEIDKINPDVVCFSIYTWNQSHIKSILKNIRKIKENIIIVCGGPDISWNANSWLEEFPVIDFIVQGAGEKAFEKLCCNNFSLPDKIISLKNYHFNDIPLPYLDNDFLSLKHRYIYYEASRGCVCRCTYCLSSLEKYQVEYKTIDKIKEEISFLLFYEPIIIKFIDRSFNSNNSLCLEIWDFLKTIKTKTKFHFEVHPLFINDEQISLLKTIEKNKFQLEVGIQSIHTTTLALIDRQGTWECIKPNIEKLSTLKNIHLHYDLIVGLPGENLSLVLASFSEIIKYLPNHIQIGFLKLLPGTKLYSDANKYGYMYESDAPYKVLSSANMLFSDFISMYNIEQVIDTIYNKNIMQTFTREVINILDSSHEYFLDLGDYYLKKNVQKTTTSRKIFFEIVWNHLQETGLLPNKQFLFDCLRYDWYLGQDTHFYPDFLQADICDNYKEKNYLYVKTNWQKNQNSKYKKKIKNIVFFAAEDIYFQKKYLNGSEGVAKLGNTLITHIESG